MERFNGTALDEFFRTTMRETFYRDVDSLHADLDTGLRYYNHDCQHPLIRKRLEIDLHGKALMHAAASRPMTLA